MIKIWIDDERPMPEGYNYWCYSTNETLTMVGVLYRKDPPFVELNLDHDAGEYADDGGDYINILKALSQPWAEYYFTEAYPLKVRFHSANPVGVKNMRVIVKDCPWMEEV